MLNLAVLKHHIGTMPRGGSPHELARLPDLTLSVQFAWHELWQKIFHQNWPPACRSGLCPQDPLQASIILASGWLIQCPAFQDRLHPNAVTAALHAQTEWFVYSDHFWQDRERQEEWLRLWIRQLTLQLEEESPWTSTQHWERISSKRRESLLQALEQQQQRRAAIQLAQIRWQQWQQP